MIKSVLIHKHAKDCFAIKEPGAPWAHSFTKKIDHMLGTRRGPVPNKILNPKTAPVWWLVYSCRDSTCDARVAILEENILNKTRFK